jgi:hypothetical protein
MYKIIIFATVLLFSSCTKKNAWHMGVDANNDGIRDDIAGWILNEFQKRPRVMAAMRELAKIDPARCDYKFYAKCLEQVADDGIILQIQLFEKTIDTDERKKAFDQRVKSCPAVDDRYVNMKCQF